MRRITIVLLSLLLLPPAGEADESPFGSLEVTVLDPLGLVLPDATVRVVETGAAVRSDATGLARFDGLPAGVYTVSAVASSLQPIVVEGVRVSADRVTSIAAAFVLVRSRDTQVDVVGEDLTALRQTPGSVDLISRSELRASHAIDANEVLRRVPGLTVREDSGPVGMRLNIGVRGLNPDRSRQVLILEDGLPLALAPYGEPEMYYSPPIDRMQRVEVVKGSGSILFGPQTIGGVINFVTPDPPARPRATLDLTAGQRDLFIGQGSFGTTMGRVGFHVNGLRKQGDGFRQFRFDISDVTAKVTWGLTDRQSLAFKLNYYDEGSNSTYLGLTQAQFDADPNINVVPDDRLSVRRLFGSVHHRVTLGSRALLSTTAFAYGTERLWRRQDFDREPVSGRVYADVAGDPSVPGGAVYLRPSAGGRDREFQVAGVETRLMLDHRAFGVPQSLEGGGRYLHEEAEDRFVVWSAPRGGSSLLRDYEFRPAHAVSLFAQNRLQLGPRVTLTPGLRIERFAYTRHIVVQRVGGVPSPVDIRRSDDLFEAVPGVGMTFQAAPPVTLFAGAHRGFAPPRVKDAIHSSGVSLELEAERSWNYEAGARWSPRAGLHGEATVFVLDFSNQIIPAAESGGATTTLINGGRTLHRGIELAASADFGLLRGLGHGFSGDLRYTWLPTARFESGIFDGNRLPYAPAHTVTLIGSYRSLRGLNIQVDYTLLGDQVGDNAGTIPGAADGTIGRVPEYGLWNASAEYRMMRGRVQMSPFVTAKNLANRIYIASRAPEGIQPGPFRQINAGMRMSF